MGASEWGKPPNTLRAKGVKKEEEGIKTDRGENCIMMIFTEYCYGD
jgi:hypothetical protein